MTMRRFWLLFGDLILGYAVFVLLSYSGVDETPAVLAGLLAMAIHRRIVEPKKS
jgi:hypothetical protein